ncbi:MAG: hypothetical protein QGH51_01880 [Planctomycetota bacterium]|jgi:hypothetical protein|nr:hypothetical protein [Planctomycetota bacterium]MDP6940750.1 hypothetical protein [Planctomycetota bacterium]
MKNEKKEKIQEEPSTSISPQKDEPTEHQETAETDAPQFKYKKLDGRDPMKFEDVADK